jgi:MoaA/NifB/PqqE/SkfB family radical SAM enzyme
MGLTLSMENLEPTMKFLSIHITDLCNSSCRFCVVASPLYVSNSVDYESILRFLEANAGQGFEAVNLHGGEPTVHPMLLDLLQKIKDLGYPEVHLQTNAIRLADPLFSANLVSLGTKKFIVSLHGDQPEIHDSQTGTAGGLKRTLEGIRNVKRLGAHVRTNTVITRQNLQRLTDICRLACELGVDHINLSNLHPVGSALYARDIAMPDFNEVQEQVYRAVDLVVNSDRVITLEGFPYCVIRDCRQYQLNNEHREIRMLMRGQVINDYERFMSDVMRVFGEPCQHCRLKAQCGGVYPQYIEYNGWKEFAPILDTSSSDLQPSVQAGAN